MAKLSNLEALKKEKENKMGNFLIARDKLRKRIQAFKESFSRDSKQLQKMFDEFVSADERYEEQIGKTIRILEGDFEFLEVVICIDRYVYGNTFQEIADNYGYSLDYIKHKHSDMVKKYNAKYN